MKIPKLLSLLLISASLAACGSQAAAPASSGLVSAAAPAGSASAKAAASASAPPSSATKPAALIPLKIGTTSLAAPSAIVPVTKYAGMYEKYGLDVDVTYIEGSKNLLAAMITGQVPITYQGSPEVIGASLAGADIVMIAGAINTIFFSVFTKPDITDASQLKGKKIGYTFAGNDEAGAKVGLAHLGLSVPRDLSPVNMPGGQAARITALQNGSVEAISIAPPFTYLAKKAGLHELVNSGDLGVEFQSGTFATSRAYLKEHRDVVVRFMRALSDGIKYYKTNKEGSIKSMGDYTKTTDRDILEQSWQDFAIKYTNKTPYMTIKGLQYVMDNVIREPSVKNHKPEDFIDQSIVKQLDDEGVYRRLWGDNYLGTGV